MSAVLRECDKSEVLSTIGKNDILLRKPNVVYTPHIAFDSQEALERIRGTTVQNIVAFASGEKCSAVEACDN
jgi:D-lactate dehydrogenase